MKYRHRVSGLLILLFAITYIDRVCISVAGPRMQEDLDIDPVGWGWVTAMFTLSYCLFEIPTGALGDRIGPRRVLTRVVLWWSAFTSLTGMVSNYYLLLLTRFCFGAGEAGAFPNASIVVSRWFPPTQRASICRGHADGEPDWRSHRAAAGRAHPDPLWMARVLLCVRRGGRDLGGRLVHLVPRFSRGEAGSEPGGTRRRPRVSRRRRRTVFPGGSRCVPKACWPCWARPSATSTCTPSSRRGFTRFW